MPEPIATITISLYKHATPEIRLRGVDPMQAAQACATAAAQIVLGQRQKAGQASERSLIEVPGVLI